MPRDKTSTKGGVTSSSNTRTKTQQHCRHSSMDEMPFPTTSMSSLPPTLRIRLHELFVQIEKEFELLYQDNLSLQEKVDILTERSKASNCNNSNRGNHSEFDNKSSSAHFVLGNIVQRNIPPPPSSSIFGNNNALLTSGNTAEYDSVDGKASSTLGSSHTVNNANNNTHLTSNTNEPNKGPSHSKAPYTQKLRCQTNKLRAQTTRIMSNLKNPSSLTCTPIRRYMGHKDGIWEVTVSRMGLPIIGTASADHTATIWGMHSGQALLHYTGHSGSVNSLRFHPSKELVLTASGDGTVHIWQCAVHLYNESSSGRVASSEDELDPIEKEYMAEEDNNQYTVLRTPLRSLNGHNGGVVIAADWLPPYGEQAVTAGWDRLACIWDTQTGQLIQQLAGHDGELTHTATHHNSRLVVTSSKDSTFRLWDFRESIHSVSVFQGHQDTVTSAVFTKDDQVVSGSDDRSVKIWDLRNMRTPVATIQSDSAINTLAVSPSGIIAIPLDNRNVRLYDLNGQRVARLPRNSRQGHSRMVCCAAWSQDNSGRPNLFTCGFDRVTLGWSIQPREIKDGDGGISTQIGHGAVSNSNTGNQASGQGSNSKQNPRNKDQSLH